MMGLTHTLVGLIRALIGKGYWAGDSLAIAMVMLGALLPDIDSENSLLGRKVKAVARLLEHRGFTHSLAGMLVFVALIQAALYVTGIQTSIAAFMYGYLSHLAIDALTVKGIEPFYPLKIRIQGPIETNSIYEKLIFTMLLTIAVKMVYF